MITSLESYFNKLAIHFYSKDTVRLEIVNGQVLWWSIKDQPNKINCVEIKKLAYFGGYKRPSIQLFSTRQNFAAVKVYHDRITTVNHR